MRPVPPSFAAPRLLARERAHRRVVAASVTLLLLFGTSPVFGHHVADPLTTWLSGRDHFLSLCIVALHELMAPMHRLFHLLLGLGVVYAVVDRVGAVRRLAKTMRMLNHAVVTPRGAIARAARIVGVDLAHVRVVRGSAAPAFTAGMFRPVIFVAESLAARLSPDELQAVLAHEEAHRRRRDPLRLSAWRFLACTLFFLPALRGLVEDMADEAEIAADDSAARHSGVQPLALASALVTIAQRFGSGTALSGAVGVVGRDLLDRRVRRLAGEEVLTGTHVTRRSIATAAVVLGAAWLSGILVSHPLPTTLPLTEATPSPTHHCMHENAGAFSHLFCLGSDHGSAAGADCPHAKRVVHVAP